jgi:hypothetical protein
MRSLFGKVALVLALVIATITVFAGEASARPAHATRVDETSVQTLVCTADAAHLEATGSSGHAPLGLMPNTDDPGDDPDTDNLGTEREVPGVLTWFGVTGLDAPHSSRMRHLSAVAEAAVARASARRSATRG